MTTLLSSPHLNAYHEWIRPHGVLEEFACQRLAVARWYYERATALAAQFENESPESVHHQNLARRWECSYNTAMRELRQLQTGRALANPNGHAPLADVEKIHRLAKRIGAAAPASQPADCPQTQSAQSGAKRNAGPYPNTARNASCPCGSGNKYKRCCGVGAPAVLYAA